MKRFVTLITLLSCLCAAQAQELEYALELGAMGGLGFYLGDANYHGLYKQAKPAAALMGRYNLNPRMSVKLNLAYGKVAGDARNGDNKFPDIPAQQWHFDEPLVDVGCQYEISFWGYGTGAGYKGSRRLAPYIQMGLGATVCNGVVAANIPLGFGVKYKLKPRWNVGVDWSMRFCTSDGLDGITDPYAVKSGTLKNKDSYSFTMVYISYDLCPKYRKCNNE